MHTADPLHAGISNHEWKTLFSTNWLVEFMDSKPGDMVGCLYIYGGNRHISEPMQFKPILFKGHLYMQPLEV